MTDYPGQRRLVVVLSDTFVRPINKKAPAGLEFRIKGIDCAITSSGGVSNAVFVSDEEKDEDAQGLLQLGSQDSRHIAVFPTEIESWYTLACDIYTKQLSFWFASTVNTFTAILTIRYEFVKHTTSRSIFNLFKRGKL